MATLLEETSIEKITVKALADQADIDRKDLLPPLWLHRRPAGGNPGEFLAEALQLLASYDPFSPDFDALGFFRQINRFIDENSGFYHRMVIADQYKFFYNELKDSLKEFLYQDYRQREELSALSPVKLSLYTEYVTAGVMAIYVEWLKHPAFDLEEVAEAASELTYGGFQAVRMLSCTRRQQKGQRPLICSHSLQRRSLPLGAVVFFCFPGLYLLGKHDIIG